MGDFNELQPEEKAYPVIVQGLQTAYRLTPQERRVLERVQERLTQHASGDESEVPLPIEEVLVPISSDRPRPGMSRSMRVQPVWSRRLNTLVAVLACCVLVGTLAAVFAAFRANQTGGQPSQGGITILLAPANASATPSQAALDATRTTLLQRFNLFGLRGSSVAIVTRNGKPQFRVTVPHFSGDEQQTIRTLTETGLLEFWNTNTDVLALHTHFDRNQYRSYNADGKPAFTGQDIQQLGVSASTMPQTWQVNFALTDSAGQRFFLFTENNVDHVLTLTLDESVIQSAVIHQGINGQGVLSQNSTQQEAQALFAILKTGVLAVPLQPVENA